MTPKPSPTQSSIRDTSAAVLALMAPQPHGSTTSAANTGCESPTVPVLRQEYGTLLGQWRNPDSRYHWMVYTAENSTAATPTATITSEAGHHQSSTVITTPAAAAAAGAQLAAIAHSDPSPRPVASPLVGQRRLRPTTARLVSASQYVRLGRCAVAPGRCCSRSRSHHGGKTSPLRRRARHRPSSTPSCRFVLSCRRRTGRPAGVALRRRVRRESASTCSIFPHRWFSVLAHRTMRCGVCTWRPDSKASPRN